MSLTTLSTSNPDDLARAKAHLGVALELLDESETNGTYPFVFPDYTCAHSHTGGVLIHNLPKPGVGFVSDTPSTVLRLIDGPLGDFRLQIYGDNAPQPHKTKPQSGMRPMLEMLRDALNTLVSDDTAARANAYRAYVPSLRDWADETFDTFPRHMKLVAVTSYQFQPAKFAAIGMHQKAGINPSEGFPAFACLKTQELQNDTFEVTIAPHIIRVDPEIDAVSRMREYMPWMSLKASRPLALHV